MIKKFNCDIVTKLKNLSFRNVNCSTFFYRSIALHTFMSIFINFYSAKIGKMEDQEDIRREEEHKKRKMMLKKQEFKKMRR